MEAFHNFHSSEIFEKSFNATYIALIPKKAGAKELKDFRPISLIGSFYKLISKVLTERTEQGRPGVLCKLDIEKAYDHSMMRQMGFEEKWINWIKFCIFIVKFSVLINGSPERFFNANRGIRQGVHLSPFLFIIAMEGLNNMLNIATAEGRIQDFEVSSVVGRSVEITNLQFTNQLWQIFLNLKGISWTMPSKIDDTMFSWDEAGSGAKDRS
ncbi:uncharacterized protein LOC124889669 [Capsicum annuum]|uniref:uncharacterized protein LOC124889669 n=1 Tax=Capsicum annuum TaxID=4072 RepID=UPI001FB145DD|nr:uncharacterized protein LOC124889669 [Capsicum annuum]